MADEDAPAAHSIYIVTRYYRAPEIILRCPYTTSVDIWSAGCIMAEMYLRRVLFEGDEELRQFAAIVRSFGWPWDDFFSTVPPEAYAAVYQLRGSASKTPIGGLIPHASPDAVNVLEALFQLNPKFTTMPVQERLATPLFLLSEWQH